MIVSVKFKSRKHFTENIFFIAFYKDSLKDESSFC